MLLDFKSSPPQELLEANPGYLLGRRAMSGPIAFKVVSIFHTLGPMPKEAENLSPRETTVLDLLAKGFYLQRKFG